MRSKLFLLTAIVIVAGLASLAAIRALTGPNENLRSEDSAPLPDTLVAQSDRQIQLAQTRIKQLPSQPDGYNLLAAAYMQKARETGDFGFNARAESALNKSLELASEDRSTLTMR